MSGINDVTVVESQREPDGSFPTCPFPNPEERSALMEGLKVCAQTGADLLLATDPDCDRVGTAVPNSLGEYELISGNEMGAMLFEYICMQRKANGTMPAEPVAVKTIVTTDIATKIAAKYGVKLVNVLTGFKFIGEQIGFLEKQGKADSYIFGFEESYGYLAGSYVRDKDAVVASMLICEMAEFYHKQGLSLLDVRDKMYREYGHYLHTLDSFTFEGAEGSAKMAQLMKKLRTSAPADFGGHAVATATDYLTPDDSSALPPADVLQFDLEGGLKVIMRPSGTEPKIKIYTTTQGLSYGEAKQLSDDLRTAVKDFLMA